MKATSLCPPGRVWSSWRWLWHVLRGGRAGTYCRSSRCRGCRAWREAGVGACDQCALPARHLWRDEILLPPQPGDTEERVELGDLHRACLDHRPPPKELAHG